MAKQKILKHFIGKLNKIVFKQNNEDNKYRKTDISMIYGQSWNVALIQSFRIQVRQRMNNIVTT